MRRGVKEAIRRLKAEVRNIIAVIAIIAIIAVIAVIAR